MFYCGYCGLDFLVFGCVLYGVFDVGLVGNLYFGNYFIGGWVDGFEGFVVGGIDVLVVDVELLDG